MIYVVATLTIKPETRADMISAAKACIAETRKEAGNIAYDLHESVTVMPSSERVVMRS